MEHRRNVTMSLPEFGLVVGTRALLGAGIALIAGEHLSEEKRKAVGWTLLAVGALSTIPLGVEIFSKNRISGAELPS